ncbi:MAG TPA: GNAT family N-acetyltransferase [Opitutaceae bacterium]|jgi:ribosomal protein S18 acetylase RimI-like enzyme|nr:GNAT family N-acetyltransferase [Opitutaceae bacterium]
MSVQVGLNFRIRAAAPGDGRQVLRCLRRAYGRAHPLPVFAVERGFLADCGGEVLGVLAFSQGPGGFQLETVAVDPARQGRGIGSALIRFAEEEALLAGFASVQAAVPERNGPALAVCEKLGYRPVERQPGPGGALISLRKPLA